MHVEESMPLRGYDLTPAMARHRLALMLGRMRDQRWSTDDSLGRLGLEPPEERLLIESVRVLLQDGIGRLDSADRVRWGAAMLLVGARALRRSGEGPFSYDLIGELLGIEELAASIRNTERAAMADGAAFWRISLLRIRNEDGRYQRRFLGTMIRHSGGGWAILDRLASVVARRWRWAGVGAASIEFLAQWIAKCAERGDLGRGMAHALESDEARHALAARLQDVAAVWDMLQDAGATKVDEAVQALGADALAACLDAPDDAAAHRMLEHLCETSADETPGEIRWRWVAAGYGNEGVVIELPRRIRLPDVPEEADRVRLHLLDARADQGCLYLRRGDVFEHRQGARHLRVRASGCEQPVMIAQHRSGHQIGEIVAAELSIPAATVMIFDTHGGRLLRCPRPGARIALVPRPGWRMRAPAGFLESGQAPLRAWVGAMPDSATECVVYTPEGEEVPWTLAPTPVHLDIALMNTIAGMLLDGAPVVQGAPQVRIGPRRGRGTCTVHRGHEAALVEDIAVKSRGGRVELPVDGWEPGIYRLTLAFDGRAGSVRFVVLPDEATIDVQGGPRGTEVVLAGGGVRARLSLRGPLPLHCGEGTLLLGPDVRGNVVLDLAVAGGPTLWVGSWSLCASPEVVEIVSEEGFPVSQADLSLVRGGGGLRIHGAPRSVALVEVDPLRWWVRLSPQGERLFPFALLPPHLSRRDATRLVITIGWPGRNRRRLQLEDPSASRPEARVIPAAGDQDTALLRITWKQAIPGDVHVEAVPAWRPWMPAVHIPTVPAAWDDKAGYEARFSLPPGGYQVVLMAGDRRVSGMTLVCSPDGRLTPPPDVLTALERELWSEPGKARIAALLDELLETGEDERIVPGALRTMARYGVRWFRLADVLVNITGRWRIAALLRADEPTEIDRLVESYYEQMGVAWMFVCERDLERMGAALAGMQEGQANELLRSVGERCAGLLLPAARHWKGWLSWAEPYWDDTVDLQRLCHGYGDPRPLSHEERDCLREADVHGGEPDATLVQAGGNERRLRGLLELRRFHEDIGAQTAMRDVPPARRLDGAWFRHLPEQLQEFEQAVASLAWEVHRWRRGDHMSTSRMQEISRLGPLAAQSFDYWLNAWDRLAAEDEEYTR